MSGRAEGEEERRAGEVWRSRGSLPEVSEMAWFRKKNKKIEMLLLVV
jgi:hypothetical protein